MKLKKHMQTTVPCLLCLLMCRKCSQTSPLTSDGTPYEARLLRWERFTWMSTPSSARYSSVDAAIRRRYRGWDTLRSSLLSL